MMPPSTPSNNPDMGPVLRKTTILVFPPSLILLIIHGIVSGKVVPALGLLPLAGSALLGLFLVYRDVLVGGGSPVRLTVPQVLIADTLLAATLFVVLVISWIVVSEDWDGGLVMLGTYCTVPLMMNV